MNMQEFLDKAVKDNALVEKMSRAANPDEAYAIAKEAGLTESFETFTGTMKKLNDASGEMTDNEIDAVTGGIHVTVVVASLVSGTSVGTLIAAGATS